MIERAIDYGKPVRIGVNWGSLDQDLLASLMDENARKPHPLDAAHVMREALVTSALRSAQLAEALGLRATASSSRARSPTCRTLSPCTPTLPRAATIRCTSA